MSAPAPAAGAPSLSLRRLARLVSQLQSEDNNRIFAQPVDPDALKLPDYRSIIRHPMDLGTVAQQLENGVYDSPEPLLADVELVFANAMLYNHFNSKVHKEARRLLAYFQNEVARMQEAAESSVQGAASRERPVRQATAGRRYKDPTSSEEDEEEEQEKKEEEEEEEEDEESDDPASEAEERKEPPAAAGATAPSPVRVYAPPGYKICHKCHKASPVKCKRCKNATCRSPFPASVKPQAGKRPVVTHGSRTWGGRKRRSLRLETDHAEAESSEQTEVKGHQQGQGPQPAMQPAMDVQVPAAAAAAAAAPAAAPAAAKHAAAISTADPAASVADGVTASQPSTHAAAAADPKADAQVGASAILSPPAEVPTHSLKPQAAPADQPGSGLQSKLSPMSVAATGAAFSPAPSSSGSGDDSPASTKPAVADVAAAAAAGIAEPFPAFFPSLRERMRMLDAEAQEAAMMEDEEEPGEARAQSTRAASARDAEAGRDRPQHVHAAHAIGVADVSGGGAGPLHGPVDNSGAVTPPPAKRVRREAETAQEKADAAMAREMQADMLAEPIQWSDDPGMNHGSGAGALPAAASARSPPHPAGAAAAAGGMHVEAKLANSVAAGAAAAGGAVEDASSFQRSFGATMAEVDRVRQAHAQDWDRLSTALRAQMGQLEALAAASAAREQAVTRLQQQLKQAQTQQAEHAATQLQLQQQLQEAATRLASAQQILEKETARLESEAVAARERADRAEVASQQASQSLQESRAEVGASAALLVSVTAERDVTRRELASVSNKLGRCAIDQQEREARIVALQVRLAAMEAQLEAGASAADYSELVHQGQQRADRTRAEFRAIKEEKQAEAARADGAEANVAVALVEQERIRAELQAANARAEELQAASQCRVCMADAVGAVYLPCGHSAACMQCALQWQSISGECPICRQPMERVQRLFFT